MYQRIRFIYSNACTGLQMRWPQSSAGPSAEEAHQLIPISLATVPLTQAVRTENQSPGPKLSLGVSQES